LNEIFGHPQSKNKDSKFHQDWAQILGYNPLIYFSFLIRLGGIGDLHDLILFPQFAIPEDEEALQTARNIFKGYKVIPVPARELAMGAGGLNCVT
jgi:agmatine/peptidylarginine deiminase